MPRANPDSNTGLDSNAAGALAYVLGLLSGLVFLAWEKRDQYVRFHAMQSTIVFGGVVVVSVVLMSLPVLGRVLYPAFVVGIVMLWGFLMFQAAAGRRYKLPYVGDIAEQQLAKMS